MPSLHADELTVDEKVVRHLIELRLPDLANLDLVQLDSAGTVHFIYRLGETHQVRIPRSVRIGGDAAKEFRWLPFLAPSLPLRIPNPIARIPPSRMIPVPWAVYDWIPGEAADLENIADMAAAAHTLAGFVNALQRVDPSGAPANTHRGGSLASATGSTTRAIEQLADEIDAAWASSLWESAVAAPTWDLPPVWTHGDLWHSNLLVHDGHLTGVIDFGSTGIGDPAIDLLPAWSLFSDASRDAFRAETGTDDATWERGRGWALSMAVLAVSYYRGANPALDIVTNAVRMIEEIRAESSDT